MRFLITLSVLLCFSITNFSQNKLIKVDTTYTLDSIWKNDTLYIYKTRHITYFLDDSTELSEKQYNKKLSSNIKNDQIINYPYFFNSNSYLKGNKKFFDNKYFNTSFHFGTFDFSYSNKNKFLDTTKIPKYFFSAGINYTLEHQNFFISSGIKISNYYENFLFNESWYNFDTTSTQIIDKITDWEVDTVWFLNLDSLLIGDTVWIPYYDSSLNITYDTSYIQNIDSTLNKNNYNRQNKLSYIEIPIYFGRNFNFRNWQISLNLGLISSFLYASDFKIALPKKSSFIKPGFSKFTFKIYSSVGINYTIFKNLKINLSVFSKIPLNYQYIIEKNKVNYYNYGLSLGFCFKF